MELHVKPGRSLHGSLSVPGDKSIAHRWLTLAATARGQSRLLGLPRSLDVRSTAACLAGLSAKARSVLDLWSRLGPPTLQGGGSTWNASGNDAPGDELEVEGEGYMGLLEPPGDLDCGNSGTTMRLLAGVVSAAHFRTVLTGDVSLSARPMERVAEPLRSMGARIATVEGHAPLTIVGDDLHGIEHRPSVPSAQVKSAVLLAGAQASGSTTVVESVGTRDHTERALTALGAPVRLSEGAVSVSAFQHQGFSGQIPGDPSSAAFLVAAAALSGSQVTLVGVGLNPTRLHFVDVMRRMGVRIHTHVDTDELGEPVGTIHVDPCDGIVPTRLAADEIPRVIDEIPVLASLAAFAPAETWFLGVGELRVKESDRLSAVVSGLRALGGEAAAEGEDLVIVGGGLDGGRVASGDDHRMAMSLTVAALGATGPSTIEGIEAADVSFPGFTAALRKLGADVEASR